MSFGLNLREIDGEKRTGEKGDATFTTGLHKEIMHCDVFLIKVVLLIW